MWRLLLVGMLGCGRIGFDNTNRVTDSDPSGYVLVATQLSNTGPYSYVDLAVDWGTSIAYLGTRHAGTCFEVVDFSATPIVIDRVGPPNTSGDTCLGISLDPPGNSLLVSSYGASKVDRFTLGQWSAPLGTVAVDQAHRMSHDVTGSGRFFVGRGPNQPGFQVVQELASSPWLALGLSFDSAVACPDGENDLIDMPSHVVLSGCSTDNSPVEVVDDVTMALVGTIPAAPSAGTSGFWSSARSADGTVGVMLGWVSVVLDHPAPTGYTLRARFDNDDVYRGATPIDRGLGPEVAAIRSDSTLDILSLAGAPTVVASGSLGVGVEGYAIRVDPTNKRAIVVTNRGWFVIVDLTKLPAANLTWPTF